MDKTGSDSDTILKGLEDLGVILVVPSNPADDFGEDDSSILNNTINSKEVADCSISTMNNTTTTVSEDQSTSTESSAKRPKSNESAQVSSSQQSAADVVKTPVTILQELCVKRGFSPAYECMKQSGQVHAPTFVMKCKAGEFEAVGEGRTKKLAKHHAAQLVLALILKINKEDIKFPESSKPAVEDEKDMQCFNPIGLLQEMALTQNLPSLQYDLESDEGPPHQKTFTISCSFKGMKTLGVGKTKKMAKKDAAIKMLSAFKQNDIAGSRYTKVFKKTKMKKKPYRPRTNFKPEPKMTNTMLHLVSSESKNDFNRFVSESKHNFKHEPNNFGPKPFSPYEPNNFNPRPGYGPNESNNFGPKPGFRPNEQNDFAPNSGFRRNEQNNFPSRSGFGPRDPSNFSPRPEFGHREPSNFSPRPEFGHREPSNFSQRSAFRPNESMNYAPRQGFRPNEPNNFGPRTGFGHSEPSNYNPRMGFRPQARHSS